MVLAYYVTLALGILSLLAAIVSAYVTLKREKGTPKMQEIAGAIQEGATAYLNRQLKVIFAFAVVLAIIFYFIFPLTRLQIIVAFIVGAVASYLTAYLGMNVAVRANMRTAKSAEKNEREAFRTAIIGGSVTGFAAVGFALIGLSALLLYFNNAQLAPLIGFGFGASLVSLFARVGGGIYTKAADVGADLVGKTELNLPEDDPRNPAVIADNVGDNVGDCAGMAADVFESYAVTLVAAILIAIGLAPVYASLPRGAFIASNLIPYALLVACGGVVGSLISMLLLQVRIKNAVTFLYAQIFASVIISAIIDYAITTAIALPISYFYAVLAGLVIAILLFAITDYYTGRNSRQVRKVAAAAQGGAGTAVISGLAVGLRSTWLPLIIVAIAIFVSYSVVGNVYGIGIAAVGMLSLTATVLTIDSFGPITDNAGGIAEMSSLPHHVRNVTDELDAVGNTTKATTKGFAIGGAALSATALFVAFAQAVGLTSIDALNPFVDVGVLIGALLPFVFSSFLMEAVGNAANLMVLEVRRQVKSIRGLLQGKAKPDYAKAVDIATVTALKSLAVPELIAILTPIIIGLVLGKEALGGLLVGMIPASFVLALFMANAGATMDNAKKYVEAGKYGGKGSEAHKASVVGDTVGDPLKDTAGPSLNSMIKVVSTISILLAPVFLAYALI